MTDVVGGQVEMMFAPAATSLPLAAAAALVIGVYGVNAWQAAQAGIVRPASPWVLRACPRASQGPGAAAAPYRSRTSA